MLKGSWSWQSVLLTRELVEFKGVGDGEEEELVAHGHDGRDAQVVVVEHMRGAHGD